MSEEGNNDEDVGRLRKDLKEWIDHRIEYNNGFANLLRGDYSIFLSLIALILSVYGALKLEFWPQLYVLSVYLMFGIWIFYTFIGTLRHKPKGKEMEELNKIIGIKKQLKGIDMGKLLRNVNIEKFKILLIFEFKLIKLLLYSLWTLFVLSVPMLWVIGEKRWWLWIPAILFSFILPLIAKKGLSTLTTSMDEMMGNEEVRESRWKDAWRWVVVMLAIAFVLVLTICVIFLYYVLKELFFIISSDLSALFGVILTMTLILISLAFLTEYLSMKFMITEISKQNHYLAVIRMEIDRIEDTEVLKKHKKKVFV